MKKTHCRLKADSAISVLRISKCTGVPQTMIPREHPIDSKMYFNSFKPERFYFMHRNNDLLNN